MVLNFIVPEQAFEVVLNIAAFGTMASWVAISLSHQKFLKLAKEGKYTRPEYRAPGGRFADWSVLTFMAIVIVLMAPRLPRGHMDPYFASFRDSAAHYWLVCGARSRE